MIFDKDIINLKGIGDKTALVYNKVGIYTYGDLIYYYPRDYIQYEEPVVLDEDNLNKPVFYKATVISRPLLRRNARMQIVTVDLLSGSTVIKAVWFNMPYLVKSLVKGVEYIFGSCITKNGNSYHAEHPTIFTIEQYNSIKNTLQPIYPLTKGLTNNSLRKSIRLALEESFTNGGRTDSDISDNDKALQKSLNVIHFPKNKDELRKAREKLVYDEFFMFMLSLRFLKEDNDKSTNDFNIKKSDVASRLIDELPYELTNAQLKVFNEIEADLAKNHSMSRLVQGDVGCGKTIIAILSCITVGMSGYQSALMAPTEILAKQHYESCVELFEEHNIPLKVCLLTGSMTKAQKRAVYSQIENKEVDIIIGTHALIQEKVIYNNLALVITDEQHRFGVKQRESLVYKNEGSVPHVLVMSATPIPRTLAIMMYGDLDISVIDEVPKRRLPIKNCVVGINYRAKAYDFIKREIEAGHQAYIICPLVEESEGLDAQDVISYTNKIKNIFPQSIRIEYLHGKMKATEKNRIMEEFLKNEIQVLVSTTVVEVGVNVPNATVMIVENAERFGLAQLHQLRGRIGRGHSQSYCIFINNKNSDNTKKRLEILNKSNDGFFIASSDLKLRGPGDMFGIRQSGEMQFRLADIYTDADILKKASEDVNVLLENDRYLESEEHSHIKKQLEYTMNNINIHAL